MKRKTISDRLLEAVLARLTAQKTKLEECIIVAGETEGKNVLAKSRDRNYHSRVKIVRDLCDDGQSEVVYFEDLDTGYAEGLNSHGLGVVNAALAVSEDENEVKGKVRSEDGPRMVHALKSAKTIDDAVKSLVGYKGGIKGHTFVGNPTGVYSIEMSSEHTPVINKLDPTTGFDVRTNHGRDHDGAGYTPDRRPADYMSSKIRKAQAEVELADVDSFEDVAPAIAKQHFDHDSNDNMLRRVPKEAGMVTVSQVAMHLPNREMIFYYFPNECDFEGIEDRTPPEHEPQINIRVVERPEVGSDK